MWRRSHQQPLSKLLTEFFTQHVDEKLGPKTIESDHEQAAYLDPDLLSMVINEITSLHPNREWVRLSKCGGHTRKDRTSRPLSAKTARNIQASSPARWPARFAGD